MRNISESFTVISSEITDTSWPQSMCRFLQFLLSSIESGNFQAVSKDSEHFQEPNQSLFKQRVSLWRVLTVEPSISELDNFFKF